ncbi:hypothetical protein AAG570_013711 [Ranatra chinensis]|uniref:Uncharacterized protein n=1 Tax=Ranatra chinensis TaxID=642074 RepID=A0ABD0YCZ1_9HEMI
MSATISAQGVVERASAELTKRITGLGLRTKHGRQTKPPSVIERVQNVFCSGGGGRPARKGVRRQPPAPPPPKWEDLVMDEKFLGRLFWYLPAVERRSLAQVCTRWRDLLYRCPAYWAGLVPVIRCKELRCCGQQERARLYGSLLRRGFHCLVLLGAADPDALDLVQNYPLAAKHLHSLALRCSSVTDRGLETLLDHLQVNCIFIF